VKLVVHRGTKEIGGSCVELRTDNSRILIDFGMPLVTEKGEQFDSQVLAGKSVEDLKELKILPDIKGLYENEAKQIDAILISHSHLDHYGFLAYVSQHIPIYMSQGAKELIDVTNLFISKRPGGINAKIIQSKKSFNIGDFRITPYLVDHSAFDALAFLIEGEEKRVFYSGDFRGHGRKSVLFERMVRNPPENIDCLLMEGSMLGRDEHIYRDEDAIQIRIQEILRTRNNITFLFTSSQNIDRLVSAYKACLRTDSIFVIDIYTAFILDKLKKVSKHIPQYDWKNIRIKFLRYHANVLAKAGLRDLLYIYNERKIDMVEINLKKNEVLMLARDNSAFPNIVKNINEPKGSTIIYSMWEGYLTDEFEQYCNENGLIIEHVHTSGHATLEYLKAFSGALNPKTLIPIHTFEAEKYPALFENVRILSDGAPFDL